MRDKVHPLELERTAGINSQLADVEVPSGSSVIGKQIVGAGFPKGALVVLIGRGKEFIVPNGGTVIELGDRLLMLAGEEDLTKTRSIVESEGPATLS